MQTGRTEDFYSSAFRADPYPTYAYLRASDPVHRTAWQDSRGNWMITRYEDAIQVLKDPRFTKSYRRLLTPEQLEQAQNQPMGQIIGMINTHMLALDPPDHTRLRALVSKAFTPIMIEQWRGRIQEITDELIDTVVERGKMELISEFAFPLPIIVITEMLGVPTEDREKFRRWSNLVVESVGNQQNFQAVFSDLAEFAFYLLAFINERREHPTEDLVSKLTQVEAEGEKLSERELISMIFLLLVAGHETTVNLIGNGTLALLQHPEQMHKLQENPALIRQAVEELLRYNGPLYTATNRWALEDVTVGDKLIARGDMITVVLSSANRDEQDFANAEELDITRPDNKHIAFGKGIHTCLGAPLARLEGQIAFSTLLRRLPDLRLDGDPADLEWRPGLLVHGLEQLPVAF